MSKIHIGKRIKEVVSKSHFTIVEFAKKISLTRDGVYKIFDKESIAADQLQKISQVLDHDFFGYYQNEFVQVNDKKSSYGFATKDELENLEKKILNEFEKLRHDLQIAKSPSEKRNKKRISK